MRLELVGKKKQKKTRANQEHFQADKFQIRKL